MEDVLHTFLISFLGAEIGFLLYIIRRKNLVTKFIDSMIILMLIISPLGTTIPLLVQYPWYLYFFIPIFLFVINGWLFISRRVVFGINSWEQKENKERDGVIKVWYYLMIGFFVITIFLVVYIPIDSKLALPWLCLGKEIITTLNFSKATASQSNKKTIRYNLPMDQTHLLEKKPQNHTISRNFPTKKLSFLAWNTFYDKSWFKWFNANFTKSICR